MSNIQKDRDGTIYKVNDKTIPPPSTETHSNRNHYYINDLIIVVNDLLDRVYDLEQTCKRQKAELKIDESLRSK